MRSYMCILIMISCFIQVLGRTDENYISIPHSKYIEALDGRYLFPDDDAIIGPSLQLFGQWEKPTKDIYFRLVQEYMNNHPEEQITLLDIGANFGTWTIPMGLLVGTRGRVYSFEAQRDMMSYLHANILLNQLENVFPMHNLVTNVTGHMLLNHFTDFPIEEGYRRNYGAYSVGGMQRRDLASTTYLVDKVRLDDIYHTRVIDCPQFIKLDVEMHELQVFLGARQLLEECQPVMLLEATCPLLVKSLVTFLNQLGYSMAWLGVMSIDFTASFNGLFPDRFDESYFGDEQRGPMTLLEGDNILAVPIKKYNTTVFDQPGLFPIDLSQGLMYLDQYNITMCYKGYWCKQKRHLEFTSTHCGAEEIGPYSQNYWKNFV